MSPKDREPLSEKPIIAEYNGSQIAIYDLDGILRDAAAQKTTVYDRADFTYPIERLTVTAEVVSPEDEEAFALESYLLLDRMTQWDQDWLIKRFNDHLAPQDNNSYNYQKRPPFHIQRDSSLNNHMIRDEETGARFVLIVGEMGILISNNTVATNEGSELEIRPQAMHTVSVYQHLESLMKLNVLLVDFINAFSVKNPNASRITGIPLSRNYDVGRERRPSIRREGTPKQLGSKAIEAAKKTKKKDESAKKPKQSENSQVAEVDKIEVAERIRLSDIGGLEEVKQTLEEVILSFSHPEVMKKHNVRRPNGILFYGYPGTGKSMLAQALANEIGAEMEVISSTDIYGKWLGQSEEQISEIFNKALQAKQPTILFFDEFESVLGITDRPSSGGADNARNSVAGIFKTMMNKLAEKKDSQVLVVAATNGHHRIDPSLIRPGRFDYSIHVPMPNEAARTAIVANIVAKALLYNVEIDSRLLVDDAELVGGAEEAEVVTSEDLSTSIFADVDAVELAKLTDGFSGADIAEIFRRVRFSKALEEARTKQPQPPINQAELLRAIKLFKTNG